MRELKPISDWQEREFLLDKIGFLLHSRYCEGVGSRRWEHRDEVKADLEALVEKYWPEYQRTPEEEKQYQQHIHSW
jgi:hypothetical protein